MADHQFHSRDNSPVPGPVLRDEIHYLLRAEPELLQAISARAPIADVLQRICLALDSQLGNVFSVISLPGDDPLAISAIARSAAIFHLYKFVSTSVVSDSGEQLGSLEMYCTVARLPHFSEIELIERATCLATVAIQRHNQAARLLAPIPPPPALATHETIPHP